MAGPGRRVARRVTVDGGPGSVVAGRTERTVVALPVSPAAGRSAAPLPPLHLAGPEPWATRLHVDLALPDRAEAASGPVTVGGERS